MRRFGPLVLLLLPPLLGCAAPMPSAGPNAELPVDTVAGAGDPTRSAILNTAYVFAAPTSVHGQPAAAARAVAQLEYLAVEIPGGPRWVGVNPVVGVELGRARAEARGLLGIASDAPPQAVIEGLYAAGRALRAGDGATAERSLNPHIFTAGPAATLRRLAALPPMPRANFATSLAQSEMYRLDRQEGHGPGGSRR